MKLIERLALIFTVNLIFGVFTVFSQGAIQRDYADICNDTLTFNPITGVSEPGHFSIPNWFTQDGTGYLAFVSREDILVPQYLWDCHDDIVGGTVIESTTSDGTPTVHQVLDYELPLEIWTVNNLRRVSKILDNGTIRLKWIVDSYLPYPGAPLNLRQMDSYRLKLTGIGYAYGTGEGEFEPGQLVEVKMTQVGMYLPQTPANSAVGRDSFPVENIQLTPLP